MRNIFAGYFTIILLFVAACSSQNDENTALFVEVAKMKIKRNDYTLGETLTDEQKDIARRNAVEASSPATYKFSDDNLFIVADKATDRVLIMYEHYDSTSWEKVRELVGNLFFEFGDPTVMAHDKTIYWAFDGKGKIPEQQFRDSKEKKQPLKTLATVKLDSSHKIMEQGDDDGQVRTVYYIISSQPLLELLERRKQ